MHHNHTVRTLHVHGNPKHMVQIKESDELKAVTVELLMAARQ